MVLEELLLNCVARVREVKNSTVAFAAATALSTQSRPKGPKNQDAVVRTKNLSRGTACSQYPPVATGKASA